MPTYRFYDEKSGIEWDEFLSIAEREKFLKENLQITQVIVPVAIVGDHIMGVGPKVDGGLPKICKESQQLIQTPLLQINLVVALCLIKR